MQGELTRAEGLYQESLAIAHADQNRELMISPLGNLGRLATYQGNYERAATLLQQAVAIARELDNRVEIADWLVHLGTLELYRGNDNGAREQLQETLAVCRDMGISMAIAHVTHCLADLALHQGNNTQAAKLVSESLSMSQSFLANVSNREFSIARLLIVAKLALAHEDYIAAAGSLGQLRPYGNRMAICWNPFPRLNMKRRLRMRELSWGQSFSKSPGQKDMP